jgi:hypothetical protein
MVEAELFLAADRLSGLPRAEAKTRWRIVESC